MIDAYLDAFHIHYTDSRPSYGTRFTTTEAIVLKLKN